MKMRIVTVNFFNPEKIPQGIILRKINAIEKILNDTIPLAFGRDVQPQDNVYSATFSFERRFHFLNSPRLVLANMCYELSKYRDLDKIKYLSNFRVKGYSFHQSKLTRQCALVNVTFFITAEII